MIKKLIFGLTGLAICLTFAMPVLAKTAAKSNSAGQAKMKVSKPAVSKNQKANSSKASSKKGKVKGSQIIRARKVNGSF